MRHTPGTLSRPAFALTAATLAAAVLPWPVARADAQSVSVTLNGTPLDISPAPQERAGRIFVPLRGIFERLGASVVYENGIINAQGNGRAISLRIGSNQATVNGQAQTLDVAPFVVGASTYVPLRFVSQALGAGVNYDAANRIVALSSNVAAGQAPPQTPPQAAGSALRLERVRPERDASVAAIRPTIEARFGGIKADPNSLRIFLDDLDITDQTSRSPLGFVYSPPSDLQSMRHIVRVTGTDANGASFTERWAFRSGTSTVSDPLDVAQPSDGAQVGSQFTVRGRSAPGALVVVQVGATNPGGGNANGVGGALGAIFGLGGVSNVRNEVTAGGDGAFATEVAIGAPSGTSLRLVVTATDPRTQAAAAPVRRMLVIR